MAGQMSPPQNPSLPWRIKSSLVMGLTGVISKAILYGLNRVEVVGLPKFLALLDSRRDPEKRQRGLITVSNHLSVVDDPLVWGVLPLSYAFDPINLRWGLGAHDICFKNKFLASFFTYGQVLPTHRLQHSPYGGLFQPSMTQAIRLLSDQPYTNNPPPAPSRSAIPAQDAIPSDPFTAGSLAHTYTTTGHDTFPAPSSFQPRNRRAWVHVFPEGLVHQHAAVDARYFKWGVARLILEAEPAPDVVPVFIDGTQHVMHEERTFPRFLPRVGRRIRVVFGDAVDVDRTFGDLRQRWRGLVAVRRQEAVAGGSSSSSMSGEMAGDDKGVVVGAGGQAALGELTDDELRYGQEACAIRTEVARRVREEVLKVRASLGGYPEADPAFALAETWAGDDKEPGKKKYKSKVDGSQINQG